MSTGEILQGCACPMCRGDVFVDMKVGDLACSPRHQVVCMRCGFAAPYAGNEAAALAHWERVLKSIPAPPETEYTVTQNSNGTFHVHLEGRLDKHAAMHVPTQALALAICDAANKCEKRGLYSVL